MLHEGDGTKLCNTHKIITGGGTLDFLNVYKKFKGFGKMGGRSQPPTLWEKCEHTVPTYEKQAVNDRQDTLKTDAVNLLPPTFTRLS